MHIDQMAKIIHQTAVEHGFWDSPRNFGEMLALMHSELSEALEAHRDKDQVLSYWYFGRKSGNDISYPPVRLSPEQYAEHVERMEGDGWIFKPEGWAVEVIDCIIRALDTLDEAGVPITRVMMQKMEYNDQRQYKHGKEY